MALVTTHYRVVGDTYFPVGATLRRGGVVVDLTGLTIEFKMINDAGTEIVAWTAASIATAADGTVEFTFSGAHVATAGIYWMWFRIGDGVNTATFPPEESDGNLARLFRMVLTETS